MYLCECVKLILTQKHKTHNVSVVGFGTPLVTDTASAVGDMSAASCLLGSHCRSENVVVCSYFFCYVE